MHVLMLSRDPKVIEPRSAVFARMEEHRKLVTHLEVILVTKQNYFKLFRFKPDFKVDLITAQDPFETGFLGWILAKRLKTKLELQIHTDFMSPYFARESFKNRIRTWLARFLISKASCIRVVSKRIARSISRAAAVLPIFVDKEKFEKDVPKFDLHQKYPLFKFIVLVASRLEKEKNISLALIALAEVTSVHKDIGMVIVGEGSEKGRLLNQTRSLGLEKNVTFEGWSNDLASYYKTTNAFVITSNYEGYGLSLIEAAASGCPIITTDVGLVGEILDQESAVVIPTGDVRALTQAIVRLKQLPQLCTQLAKQAKVAVNRLPSKPEYLNMLVSGWQSCQ